MGIACKARWVPFFLLLITGRGRLGSWSKDSLWVLCLTLADRCGCFSFLSPTLALTPPHCSTPDPRRRWGECPLFCSGRGKRRGGGAPNPGGDGRWEVGNLPGSISGAAAPVWKCRLQQICRLWREVAFGNFNVFCALMLLSV